MRGFLSTGHDGVAVAVAVATATRRKVLDANKFGVATVGQRDITND